MMNKRDQTNETRDFNVENPSNNEEKKLRASANKTSLYRVRTKARNLQLCDLSQTGGLQEIYITVEP